MKKCRKMKVLYTIYVGKKGYYLMNECYEKNNILCRSLFYMNVDILKDGLSYEYMQQKLINKAHKDVNRQNKHYMSLKRNPAKIDLRIVVLKRFSKKFSSKFENLKEGEMVLDDLLETKDSRTVIGSIY